MEVCHESSFISETEIDHKLNKRLNIAAIAERSGLSPSTVSRVLAGKANTSAQARERVLACARELGVIDGLAVGRLLLNNLIVFAPQRAFDERSDIFYYRVIQSIGKALAPHEVRLRYCALEENDSDSQLFVDRLGESACQAAILLGIDDPHIHEWAALSGKPCVLVNCRDERMHLPSIAPDHQLIGQCAARYLFEMGHRAVMTVMCLRRYTMDLRLAGIKAAWRAQNLRFLSARDLITLSSFSASEAEARVGEWLDAHRGKPLPSAFLVGGDFMAAGTVNALRQRGLRVPQDVSVMSIDGFNLAAIQDVPLTAVQVPRDELGYEAVQLLQQRLLRPQAPCGSLLLYGELVVRDSVRRIRAGSRRAVRREGLYDD
ncbi:LacI family transcriptional regulator [Edwardsiella tarda]|uniref:LacI family DNA-binding transcriptional regulator n=1 Tax=Edwardsiella tarda TaxID=636 RepID=UPI00351C97C2